MTKLVIHISFWVLSFVLFTQATSVGKVGYVDWVYSATWFILFFFYFYLMYFGSKILISDVEDIQLDKAPNEVFYQWDSGKLDLVEKKAKGKVKLFWLFPISKVQSRLLGFFISALYLGLLISLRGEDIFNFFLQMRIFPKDVFFVNDANLYERLSYIIIFFLFATVFSGSEYVLKQQQLKKQLEKEKRLRAEAENRTILQQVNPHFLYNSLNAIYAQSVEGKPDVADSILLLSEMMRYPLTLSGERKVALKDEIVQIERYLKLQKMRFSSRVIIEFKKQLSDDELDSLVPPLLIMIPIENAFKHADLRLASNVKVVIRSESNSIVMEVQNPISDSIDNKKKQPSTGQGLIQLKEGLDFAFGVTNYTLSYGKSEEGAIYNFELRIPKELTSNK